MSESDHLVLFIARGVFTLGTVVTLAVALWSRRWPQTQGTINISVFERESGWNFSRGVGGMRITREVDEKLHLDYSYLVDGQEYHGKLVSPIGARSQISLGGGTPVWSSARDRANAIVKACLVNMYFCPLFPKWACLEPGGFLDAATLFAFTLVLFLVG